jgi:hypothetical protein
MALPHRICVCARVSVADACASRSYRSRRIISAGLSANNLSTFVGCIEIHYEETRKMVGGFTYRSAAAFGSYGRTGR